MALNVRRTGSAEYGRWIKSLFVGPPGSGKTLLSSTFPSPFYVSAEGGLMSIADRGIPHVELKSTQELHEIKTTLAYGPAAREKLLGFPVLTVVIDTIDEVQQIYKKERMKEKNRDHFTQEDWGWIGDQLESTVRGFRNLDMHVVFTCHVKESRDEELGTISYVPDLQGRMGGKIPEMVDLALLLTSSLKTVVTNNVATPTIERTLQTFPDHQHLWIKDRSGKLPSSFPVNFEDDFERMNKTIFAGIDQTPTETPVEQVSAPVGLQSSSDVASSTSVDEAADAAVPVEKPVSDEEFTCEACGEVFHDPDQARLSEIRMRKTLDKACYQKALEEKRGSKK